MADGPTRSDRESVEEPAALAFFFSDLEGSTRLATQLGTQAYAQALDAHRALVREAFGRHGGREVSTGGDSFFAVFALPSDAVAAAVATQRAHARPIGPGVELRIRIGVHVGHAVRVGDDYLGLDVNRAARVADAGHGGQILVSDAARAALGPLVGGLGLRDLGRHRLKDVGPERLWQVEGPDLPAGPFAAPRSLEAHPSNLPAPTADLVGREAEQARLAEILVANQVVTVVGAGGIGKSRLAIEVARSLIARFPDGVSYLEMASVPNADVAAAALLGVLGLPEATDEDALDILRTRLRDRDMLIVLDTADRVAGIDRLSASLAAACPRVRLLVTSRAALRITAEREMEIGPLPSGDGVKLFEARARSVRPGWEATPASLAAIDRLVDRLDGIPLAIELAAARVRILTPTAILDRLERRLPALAEAPSDLPDRHRTLEATIGWSLEQLQPAEQRLFARLGVFVGPFDLAAVEGVAGETAEDVLGALEQLVDRSLVTADRSLDEPAFRLLGPIRDFARDALRRSGEDASARERHATYHLELARGLADSLERADALGAAAAIERAEPELRAALEWALDGGAAVLALELAGWLGRYWWVRGRVREGVGWLERALASDAAGDPATDRPTLARALYWAGVLLDDARRSDEAHARLESALAFQRELDDERAVARTLNSLGVVARSRGELERATELFTDSIEAKRRIGDERGIAVSLSNLGILASDRGDLDRAAVLFAEALALDESSGSTSGAVVSRTNLGTLLLRAGRPDEGLDLIRRALPGIRELGDPELVAAVLTGLSHPRLAAGDPDAPRDAARLTLAGEELRQREGIPVRPVERDEVDDLLRREQALLGPEMIASIRAEASVIDLDAALRIAFAAAGLPDA